MFNLHKYLVALFIYVGDKLRNTHHPWPRGSIYSFLEVGRPPFLAFLFTTYLYDKARLRFINIYDITNMYCKCGVNSDFQFTLGLLICTLISKNPGLEKSRSASNLRKISGPANLDFFSRSPPRKKKARLKP